jgi:hypothetical protein
MIKTKNKHPKVKKSKVIKGFKSVDWVRSVRDKMYEENKRTNIHKYIQKILS